MYVLYYSTVSSNLLQAFHIYLDIPWYIAPRLLRALSPPQPAAFKVSILFSAIQLDQTYSNFQAHYSTKLCPILIAFL